MTFQNNPSSFKVLTASANDGIFVNSNINTTVGNMILDADANGAIGSDDALHLNANLASLGNLTLSGLNGGILLESNSNLSGSQMTFNQQIDGARTLALSGDNTVGAVNIASLSLDTQYANLTGFVNGLSGQAAIDIIVLVNTILPATHYFDGIDMFQEAPVPPIPPTPPLPPEPAIVTAEQSILQYIFPNSQNANIYGNVLANIQLGKGSSEKKTGKNCTNLGSNIEICSAKVAN